MKAQTLAEREADFQQLFTSIWERVKKDLMRENPSTPEHFWIIPDKYIYRAVSDYCATYPGDEILWQEDRERE
jgi:hypothetical protein